MSEKIRKLLRERNLDAVLLSDPCNLRYHSGFCGDTGYLYASANRQVLLTDGRFTTQARRECRETEVLEVGASLGYGEAAASLLAEDQAKRIGFEDNHLIVAEFLRLREKTKDVQWVRLGEAADDLRCIKEDWELERIEKAQEIAEKALDHVLGELRPGMTELTVAAKLDYAMKERGAEGNSFDTIAASGANAALPHAIPSRKELEKGDFLTLDFGCRYEGYCSDLTRTVVIGKAGERQKAIYQTVLKAQLAALDALRPGKTGAQIDAVARKIIGEAGYGDCFGHGLGHSVGLLIHEEPRLSGGCHRVLEVNMTETVEPGIYVPGFGGVRIEDLVVLTENGCRNLTHAPKELAEV